MKTAAKLLALALTFLILNTQLSTLFAQGTAFTYQGRLNVAGAPANGSYDLTFALFNSLSGGTQQGTTITSTATAVSNGLFTITLDFGNQFPASPMVTFGPQSLPRPMAPGWRRGLIPEPSTPPPIPGRPGRHKLTACPMVARTIGSASRHPRMAQN
jgi:hypothetical protein